MLIPETGAERCALEVASVSAAAIAGPTEAVVLAAGAGTRIRAGEHAPLKPLTPILGRTLIERSIESFVTAGVRRLTVVVGFEGDRVAASVSVLARPYDVELRVVENPSWELGNGTSVLAAAECTSGPFYLAMADHLFDGQILDRLAAADDGAELTLAVDEDWQAVPDIDEATKVLRTGPAIADIGKGLATFDAVDTGIFICRSALFDALHCAQAGEDFSLSGGVRVLAERGEAMATPVTGQFWRDIDTPEDLALAEERLLIQELVDPLRENSPAVP